MEFGSGVQICVFPVAELFDNPGVVLGLISGSFNLSAMLFPSLFAISKDRRLCIGGVYAIAIGLLGVIGYFLLPRGTSFLYNSKDDRAEMIQEGDDNPGSASKCLSESSGAAAGEEEKKEDTHHTIEIIATTEAFLTSSNDNFADHRNKVPATQQMKSNEYIFIVTWFVVAIVPLQFYAGSIAFQLEKKGDDQGKYASLFSIFYAASPVFSPFTGFLYDHFGAGVSQIVSTLVSSVPFLVLVLGKLPIQICGMISYALGRTLVFAIFYTYIGIRFGYDNMGALAGTGSAASALCSLIQYPMINAASSGSEKAVNLTCAVLLVSSLPYSIWLWFKEGSKKTAMRRNDLESIQEVNDDLPLRHSSISTIVRSESGSLSGSFSAGTEIFPHFH